MTTIHPTAIVEDGAQLGEGVRVGPYAIVSRHARIGDRCCIAGHAVIMGRTTLGKDCSVHSTAVVGDVPQDTAYEESTESYVEVGDRTRIREGVVIHRGTSPGSATRVGNDCFLMNHSHLAHNVVLHDSVAMAGTVQLAGYVEVGEGAFIGGTSAVHQFVKIGRLSMVGGGMMVAQNMPPFCMGETGSLNLLRGLNVVGLRRAGVGAGDRKELKRAYHTAFRSDLNKTDLLAKLRTQFSSPLVGELADFIEASKRGVCRDAAQRSRKLKEES